MTLTGIFEQWHSRFAGILDVFASRVEGATGGQVQRVRHVAGNRLKAFAFAARVIHTRDAVQKSNRVRVLGTFEDFDDIALFDHAPAVHDHDPIRHLSDHTEVVGDEQNAHADLALQLAHQIQDLRLNRHVQGGRRFVRDQQGRIARERHRNHHALTHAARHLMRVIGDAPPRFGDADQLEHRDRDLHRLFAVLVLVQRDRLGDLITDGVDRVEAGHRFLENHRDVIAPNFAHLGLREFGDVSSLTVLAFEGDFALDNFARRRGNQTHDREARDGLTRPRLTDHRQRLALLDVESHTIDGLDHTLVGVKIGF